MKTNLNNALISHKDNIVISTEKSGENRVEKALKEII